jgi:hypothetical protein
MRRVILMVVLGLSVLTGCLAGCRSDSTMVAPAGRPAQPDPKQEKYENLVADCMTGQGFAYVPRPAFTPADSAETLYSGWKSVLQPPADVHAFREKYGFGLYARLVYPDDPALSHGSAPDADREPNPNVTIRDALDTSRRKAYDLALHDCGGVAARTVYPSSAPPKARGQRDHRAFRSDPKVVAAVADYAGCLSEKGHQILDPEPGTIETSLYEQATEAFGRRDLFNPDAAEQVSAAEARAGLTAEITLALTDLDCRTGYAKLARSGYAEAVSAAHEAG